MRTAFSIIVGLQGLALIISASMDTLSLRALGFSCGSALVLLALSGLDDKGGDA